MAAPITPEHIQLFDASIPEAVAEAMIESLWARATKLAPCLKVKEWSDDDAEEEYEDTIFVRSILRSVALRWADSGSGAVTQRTAGEFSETLAGYSGGLFRPDEIQDLKAVCTVVR